MPDDALTTPENANAIRLVSLSEAGQENESENEFEVFSVHNHTRLTSFMGSCSRGTVYIHNRSSRRFEGALRWREPRRQIQEPKQIWLFLIQFHQVILVQRRRHRKRRHKTGQESAEFFRDSNFFPFVAALGFLAWFSEACTISICGVAKFGP